MVRPRGGGQLVVFDFGVSPFFRRLADNRIAAHLHLAEGYVSRAYCIKPTDLFRKSRGERNIAEARQLSMYLAHVELGMSFRAIARRYRRDKSTAMYACRAIEDRRDDPGFDAFVGQIEQQITLREDPLFAVLCEGAL